MHQRPPTDEVPAERLPVPVVEQVRDVQTDLPVPVDGVVADQVEGRELLDLPAVGGIDPQEVYQELDIYGEVTATELDRALRDSPTLMDAVDYDSPNGELVQSHIIGQVFKNLGFDGIVLEGADKRFPGMSMGGGTTHYHVFEDAPQNVKSIYNQGSFDSTNPDIMMTRSNKKEIIKPLFSRKAREDHAHLPAPSTPISPLTPASLPKTVVSHWVAANSPASRSVPVCVPVPEF